MALSHQNPFAAGQSVIRTNSQAKEEELTKQPQKFACGTKKHYKEMTSCEGAMFYLKECGLTKIDGDGRPCEALCK